MSNLFFSFPPPLLSLPLPCPFLSFFFLVKVKKYSIIIQKSPLAKCLCYWLWAPPCGDYSSKYLLGET